VETPDGRGIKEQRPKLSGAAAPSGVHLEFKSHASATEVGERVIHAPSLQPREWPQFDSRDRESPKGHRLHWSQNVEQLSDRTGSAIADTSWVAE
jgi:hypothetical protein